MMAKSDCPCGSGQRYGDCCRSFHRDEKEAPDAVALMRSRFSAYAVADAEYLWRTLAAAHEDRRRPESEALRDIRRSASTHRYRALTILDSRPPDARGVAQVLFLARVFLKGRDLSFVERSDFIQDGFGWRYLHGDLKPVSEIAGDPKALRIDSFLA